MRSVRAKLLVSLGFLVTAMVTLAIVNWFQGQRIVGATDQLYHGGVEVTRALGESESALQLALSQTFNHVATDSVIQQKNIEQMIAQTDMAFRRHLQRAEGGMKAEGAQFDVATVRRSFETFVELRDTRVLPKSRAGNDADGLALLLDDTGRAFSATLSALHSIVDQQIKISERVKQDVEQATALATGFAALGALTVACIGMVISLSLSSNISGRLSRLIASAQQLQAGNLQHRAEVVGDDEIAQLARSVNETASALERMMHEQNDERSHLKASLTSYGSLVERIAQGDLTDSKLDLPSGALSGFGQHLLDMRSALRLMTSRIHEAVRSLSSASAEMQAIAQQNVASANESASGVAETVASVDEVSRTAESVAATARGVENDSKRSIEVSAAGQEAVKRAIEAMENVRTRVQSVAERILALSENVQEVDEIISTVNELAEQSNILSLNASIEAARAGEQGHGFAVVAREMRSLAEQSRRATSTVREMITGIQRSTGKAVMAAENGTKSVAFAVDTVTDAGKRIAQLTDFIRGSASSAEQIQSGAQQQVLGMSQISQAIRSIDDAARQSVDGTRHVEDAAHQINTVSSRLQQATAQYRT